VDREAVTAWVEAYERAWRTPGTEHLAALFTPDASYLPSPWRPPVRGLEELGRFWDSGRDGPDEQFEMTYEVVAVDKRTAVVRVAVDYHGADRARWRDLWVMSFAEDGRCAAFEEWPFASDQPDGH
jgi:uncharacterized protein (TIGR02246 family)